MTTSTLWEFVRELLKPYPKLNMLAVVKALLS